ncbi:MAG: excinuclease ABC subunit UvrA [Planctomycetia bacterium]|nr:excinuclease ABC subunit UvrA [Planctomycetia bacterium]
MSIQDIHVKGAREHNLQNVELLLPKNELICFTGVSGSGKSSLAFDTLYAEGQRRYVESLSSYARQFLGQMPKPDVDFISGLRPSISIAQKTTGQNPRSTVGTITEIYDYLRVLFARIGMGRCPHCGKKISALTRAQILGQIQSLPTNSPILVLAPKIRGQKGSYKDLFRDLQKQGFLRARVDGKVVRLSDDLNLDRQMRHTIEIVIDRLVLSNDANFRLSEAVETALRVGLNHVIIAYDEEARGGTKVPPFPEMLLSSDYACPDCQIGFEAPSPQLFSFNSPQGMCEECDGLGEKYTIDPLRLIPNVSKSLKDGCLATLPPWKDMRKSQQALYRSVIEAYLQQNPQHKLTFRTALGIAWKNLPEGLRDAILYGDQKVPMKPVYYGTFNQLRFKGIIPTLLETYETTGSRIQKRLLEKFMNVCTCGFCKGERLNPQARNVFISSRSAGQRGTALELSLPQVTQLSIADAVQFFKELELDATGILIAQDLLREIRNRLGFLMDVGLEYLTLSRTAPTLSGGELQRIRLASQVGCGLVGVLYILDEPSIGLHPRDNDRLLATLAKLRDLGNTVVVVEHDEDTMRFADRIIDFGPGAGIHGGKVVAEGSLEDILHAPESVTGQFLSRRRAIPVVATPRAGSGETLRLRGVRHHNLKNIDVEFPLGKFICVTGVSGSGKSSLVNGVLKQILHRELNRGIGTPGDFDSIEGLEFLNKMIAIDQSPIGRTPRSNPATYIKLFDEIRALFAELPESKQRGFKPGRFSFNVSGGRCEACQGYGSTKLEMDFLADVWVTCPVCGGKRFNFETLQALFKGHSISDVLEMDVQEAMQLFENIPRVYQKLQTLSSVGLDYMKIGQPSPTLSGGEAQRVKLARELVKISTGRTFYILDEPTTGLHFADIELLLRVLHSFVDAGNTVVVVEHNLDVIKTADWIIDLGPEGGDAGGQIIAQGTPLELVKNKKSYTAAALKKTLQPPKSRTAREKTKREPKDGEIEQRDIHIEGASQHNLKNISLDIPRNKMTVCSGPSGSGKSSLAMDTVYAEGQRRYVESLSSYARQFVGQMPKPAVERIEGLAPAIAIEQKRMSQSPRSTVGTVTEIYDYFRILMARLGVPYCPDCQIPIGKQTIDEIIARVMEYPDGTRLIFLAGREIPVGGKYETLWQELRQSGFVRVRIDGTIHSLDQVPNIDRRSHHDVQVVVDRVEIRHDKKTRSRIGESVEQALDAGGGTMVVLEVEQDKPETQWKGKTHSLHNVCDKCGRSFDKLSPNNFSFNTVLGWCPVCEGLGVQSGANPNLLLSDPHLTLAEGAVALWDPTDNPMAKAMFDVFCKEMEVPTNIPYEALAPRFRKILQRGTGERWFEVRTKEWQFKFQFKGLSPVVDEAARLVPSLRYRLDSYLDEIPCTECGGSRLRDDAAAVRLKGKTVDEICDLPIDKLLAEVQGWKLTPSERKVAGEIVREIKNRIQFLLDVGLEYLSLARPAPSLSGGEMQRIRLAAQVGSGLCGVLYVLDEPTIGLHPRDNRRLIKTLHKLRNLGNTLLVVEHDREVIESADRLIDFGPKAGRWGGEIIGNGTPKQVAKTESSITGSYLSGKLAIPVPLNRRIKSTKDYNLPYIEVLGAKQNNLKNINVRFPLGALSVVSGVSGSGKSTLVEDILYNALARRLHRAGTIPGTHSSILGIHHINKVIEIDQLPIGATPASNPATYTGVFERIRELFASLPEAKRRGFSARRFSFNVPGGRCEKCEGNGQLKIEMHFLPDVWVTCDSCKGQRYEEETLAVRYKGYSIADVLKMTCAEALKLFASHPQIYKILQTLCDVGLDYVALGQPAPTLSGGEAQRVKLAAELARPDTGRTLYILDEPTTGLHFADLSKLLSVLHRLVDLGNSVIVIEHNLDVMKTADWIIDLGPEAGAEGGRVVVCGTPEEVAKYAQNALKSQNRSNPLPRSYTGEFLAPVLNAGPFEKRKIHTYQTLQEERNLFLNEVLDEPAAKNLWETNPIAWHSFNRSSRCGELVGGPLPDRPAPKWDVRILDMLLNLVENSETHEIDMCHENMIKISGTDFLKTKFLHIYTDEEWLLRLVFRVEKGFILEKNLLKKFPLKPLNDCPELPLYGTEPRVRFFAEPNFDEIEFRPNNLDELGADEFRSFCASALVVHNAYANRNNRIHAVCKNHLSTLGVDASAMEIIEFLENILPGADWNWNDTNFVLTPAEMRHWWLGVRLRSKSSESHLFQIYGARDSFPPTLKGKFEADWTPSFCVFHTECVNMSDCEEKGLAEFLRQTAEKMQK